MSSKKIEKFTGKDESDQLEELKRERKGIEAQIKLKDDEEKRIKDIMREKEKIAGLQRELKQRSKKKSKFAGSLKKLRAFEGQLERTVHSDRFKDGGRGARKKGSAGRR